MLFKVGVCVCVCVLCVWVGALYVCFIVGGCLDFMCNVWCVMFWGVVLGWLG